MTLKFNFHVLKFWCLFHSLFTIAVRNSVKALSLRFIIILSTDFTDDWSKSGVVTLWLLLEGLYATKRLPHWSCLLRRDSTDSTEGSRPQLTNWKLLVVETAIDRKREKEGGERERERRELLSRPVIVFQVAKKAFLLSTPLDSRSPFFRFFTPAKRSFVAERRTSVTSSPESFHGFFDRIVLICARKTIDWHQ